MAERKQSLTAEEKEARLEQRAAAARKARQSSLQRERKLRQDKKLNVYNYLVQLTGQEDLSIATLKRILGYMYTVDRGEDVENEDMSIQELIEDAAASERISKSN